MSQSGHLTSRSLSRPQVLRRTRVTAADTTLCNYSNRVCMQPRLEGYEYCSKHILEDKNSPYKQCQYTSYKTNKRCTNAAVRGDRKDGYCAEHARRAAHIRTFINRKRRPKMSPQTLLDDLDHYSAKATTTSGPPDGKKSARTADPNSSKIMDYGSSSDSDLEGQMMDHTWVGDGDSDAESIDSEQEDPLKHASVYTAEEVALITRDKLIRLQSLYIDQFKRLQHVLKEKQRQFVHTVRKERQALGSIHYAKHDPEQRHGYDELVAMKRYHRRYGQEALLHRESKERRIAVSEGANYRPPTYPKCTFSRNNTKCGARTVPLSKYCFEHVLSDPHQVLFRRCDYATVCDRAVPDLLNKTRCQYHSQPEDISHRLPAKHQQDESRDEIDVVGETGESADQSAQLQIQLQGETAGLGLDHTAGTNRQDPSSAPSDAGLASPTKSNHQVPSVVNDLLQEEHIRKAAASQRRSTHWPAPSEISTAASQTTVTLGPMSSTSTPILSPLPTTTISRTPALDNPAPESRTPVTATPVPKAATPGSEGSSEVGQKSVSSTVTPSPNSAADSTANAPVPMDTAE